MPDPGDILSHSEMCAIENRMLQAGMHYRPNRSYSIILMSQRPGAPYPDRLSNDGKTLYYIGHDFYGHPDRARIDQPLSTAKGTLTENGRFFHAAQRKRTSIMPELVRVYEKVREGVWVYNGVFELADARFEHDGFRNVCVFELRQTNLEVESDVPRESKSPGRLIPSEVKRIVWKRDHGRCVECGSTENLHFDHIIPWSRGGSSANPENIQLLCGRHNISKRDRIQ
jgi:hypothetical protein